LWTARETLGALLIGIVLVVLLVIAWEGGRQGETVFYVSKDGNDSWSGLLEEPNTAHTDGPFRSIQRAVEAVRNEIARGLERNVTVFIRGGTYYLPEGLSFGANDSGTLEHSVTYASYPGETAILVGGVPIKGWERFNGSIWTADLPEGVETNQLFENGRRMQIAREPNTGYFEISGPVKGRERSAFTYSQGDLDPSGWDISEARVFIWQGHDWFTQDKKLVSINPENRTIVMGSDAGYPMTRGNRYYIKNVLALLDIPGECQIDNTRRKVYCWPTRLPVENQTYVVATAENLISIHGSPPNGTVRNLHFENLDLAISKKDVVRISGAENCTVKFCKIENGGQSGVLVSGHAQGIVVYGNLIRYNGLHGVSLMGLAPGREDVNHHNVVENNHIHHCGRLVGHGYGVRIYQSGHNKIVHNEIHDMPRYGTTIKGMPYQVLRARLENVTWENHWDLLHSRNNLLAYNNIYRVNLDSQDTGAMESWGPGRDNVYDHNLIHDVGNFEFGLQSGMYLDDATNYFNVTNNIIYGVHGTGGDQCIFTKGIGNRIENNILVVARGNSAAIRSMEMGGEKCEGHVYLRNIFYFESKDGAAYGFINWNETRVAESDYNLFWKPRGRLTISGGPADGSFSEWLTILGHKFDQHSVIDDPLFVDPKQRNYHLRPESPALHLGFKDIDTSEIGLEEDFPLRLRETFEDLYRIPPSLIWRGGKGETG